MEALSKYKWGFMYILGVLVKAALLLYTIKINVLVNIIYMYININIYICIYI